LGRKPKYSPKIEIFLKNRKFPQKSKFSSKIDIFVKNGNFRQKTKFSSKNEIFVKKRNFRQKIEIFVKNRNFRKKSNFVVKKNIIKSRYFRTFQAVHAAQESGRKDFFWNFSYFFIKYFLAKMYFFQIRYLKSIFNIWSKL